MCGLHWAWVSGLFAGYGLGTNWAPASKPSWAPRLDIAWMCGLNWAWVSGLFAGYGVGPIGPQLASPVGPHVEYCVDLWGKLGLGFMVVYWVWSGPRLSPSQQAQLAPRWIWC